MNRYNDKDDIIGTMETGDRKMGDIIADITTSFVVLAGIFFPSVTGIKPWMWITVIYAL